MMEKFQVIELDKDSLHAGSKAVNDVSSIAEAIGYTEKLYIENYKSKNKWYSCIANQIYRIKSWINVYKKVTPGSFLLLQHPYRRIQLFRDPVLFALKKKKKVNIISLIHDIDELRDTYLNLHHKKERWCSFRYASALIIHNYSMHNFVRAKGVPERKIVELGIFDYLYNGPLNIPSFSHDIVIAGNFERWKSGYVYKLSQMDSALKFHIYGPNYENEEPNKTIVYEGVFKPEELVDHLNYGFGLVWDGQEISYCSGGSGNYLRYNNPHKLSLYVACGIPVIIWKEAAMAKFVLDNHIGIAIDSLENLDSYINKIDESEYRNMANNVRSISKKIREGFFVKEAICRAEELLP